MRYPPVFVLMAGIFLLSLFVVSGDVREPDHVRIETFSSSYDEGDIIDGDFILNLSAPLDPDTLVVGSIGASVAKREFIDILKSEGVEYEIDQGTFTVGDSSSSKSFVFSGGGKQYTFFKLPADAVVQNVEMNIHGLRSGGSFPSFPTIDVGLDHDDEWRYFGDLSGYGNALLPHGLDETQNGGSASLTGAETYYCELIDLPSAKDFTVAVDYKKVLDGGVLGAVIFSVASQGSTVVAQGGADSCTLPAGGSGFAYAECDVHVPLFIEGERLVCVHNRNAVAGGDNSKRYYDVQMDSGVDVSRPSAYVCGALSSSGSASCVKNDNDFYIKIKPGEYTGEVIGQIPFEDGFTEFTFVDALNAYLSGCSSDCVIPLAFSSESAGTLYVDTLRVAYTKRSAGGSFSYGLFYEGTSTGSSLSSLDGVDLTQQGMELVLPLESLFLRAPHPGNGTKNMTLTVGVAPGPEDKVNVAVVPLAREVAGDGEDYLKTYKEVLQGVLKSNPEIMKFLGYKDAVTKALQTLDTLLADYLALGNETDQGVQDKAFQEMTQKADILISAFPKTLVVTKRVKDVLVPGVTDITDSVVLPNQRTQKDKDALYQLQAGVTVEGMAEYYTLIFFDGHEESGTIITKTITSSTGNAYVVEVVPSSAVRSGESINFDEPPEVVQSSNPLIVRWLHPSLKGVEHRYLLKGDAAGLLKELKTLVIPQVVPDLTLGVSSSISYRCGDGVCSVLTTEAGVIPLEDRYTCPQDCARQYPWMTWLITLLVAFGIVWYVNFYHGRYNVSDLWGKLMRKPVKSGVSVNVFKKQPDMQKKLFTSAADEQSLLSYVESALRKGFSKSKISAALLGRGWTREQVEHVFSRAHK